MPNPPPAPPHRHAARGLSTVDEATRAGGDAHVADAACRFVIQKHWARQLHYDFRLELDGVLKSWAVPKGPSLDPTVKRMAVPVEDHALSYANFEGEIEEGHYGAGRVIVWDCGIWRPIGVAREALQAGRLRFELQGRKLTGHWSLVRLRARAAAGSSTPRALSWLLIKERDASARSAAEFEVTEALPDSVLSIS